MENRDTSDVLSERFLTTVRAGYEGKLALIFMSVQALQGADHLAALGRVHATYLQTGQVVTHIPISDDKRSSGYIHFENVFKNLTYDGMETHLYSGFRLPASRGCLSSGQEW